MFKSWKRGFKGLKKGFFALKIAGIGTRDVVATRVARGGGLGCSHQSTSPKAKNSHPTAPVRGADPEDPQSPGAAAPTPKPPPGILTSFGMVSSWEVV